MATVERVRGVHELRDRVPVLTRIHVSYRLRIPEGTRETVERLLTKHPAKCPTAMSLRGAVAVSWDAEVEEGRERWGTEGERE